MTQRHLTKSIRSSIFGSLAFLLAGLTDVSAQAFAPGELLLLDPVSTSQFFDGATCSFVQASNGVQRYSAAGLLEHTFLSNIADQMSGLTIAPDGKLAVSYLGGAAFGFLSARIHLFNPDGTTFADFTVPSIAKAGFAISVGEVSAFPSGTLAIVDATNGAVAFHTEAGLLIKNVPLVGVAHPWGCTVGPDGVLYVTGGSNRVGTLSRLAADGTVLGAPVALNFAPGDVAVSHADGTLWVAGISNGQVEHLKPDGTLLGSFPALFLDASGAPAGFTGISVSPDGLTIFAVGINLIRKFDLTGHVLGDLVVPTSNSASLLAVQNPGATPVPVPPVPVPTPTPKPVPTPVPVATPAPADKVTITQAEDALSKGELKVQASSTNASATLTLLVTSSGKQIGVLTNSGGLQYKGQFTVQPNPVNITVKSSAGGSASLAVVAK